MRKKSKMVIFVLIFVTSAQILMAQAGKMDINVHGVTLAQLLDTIQSKGYQAFFNAKAIANVKNVTVNLQDATVGQVLDVALAGTGFTYSLTGNTVVISVKQEEPKSFKVSGTVRDKAGMTLPGVTIQVKGTTVGVVTDSEGRFTINLPQQEHLALIFSFIGYEKKEIRVHQDMADLSVVLETKTEEMDEVVVTGYQTIDKRKLTSSIYSLSSEDLDFQGAVRLDQMLEGKVPGLLVMTSSAAPGAATKMRLRGSNTFTGTREPLWVIDGIIYEDPVPLTADEINSWDNINLIGNAITGLNPQDIERIDVLKDASATAIYGTRAANGVIVVTTKAGKIGETSISYNFNAAVTQRPRYSDFQLMNSKERVEVSREIVERGLYFNYTPERIGYEGLVMDYWDKKISFSEFQDEVSRMESANTDWFKALYRNSFSHTHNLSLSGGNRGTRYYFSMGYTSNRASEIGSGLWRFTARMNLQTRLRENILVDARLSGSVQDADYNPTAYSVFNEAYYTNRAIPLRNDDGSLYYVQKPVNQDQTTQENVYAGYNILNELANSGRNVVNKSLNLTGSLNWELLPNLRYTGTFGLTTTTNLTEEYMGEKTWYIAQMRGWEYGEKPEGDIPNKSIMEGGTYTNSVTNQYKWTVRNQLNYNFSINDIHHFNIDLGQEANSTIYKGTSSGTFPGYRVDEGKTFTYFPTVTRDDTDYGWYSALKTWFLQAGGVYPSITDRRENTLSFYGTFTYTYQNRYSLNFNIRNDGSNRFGQYNNEKFNPVWSASARWNMNEVPSTSPYMLIERPETNAVSGEKGSIISSFPNADLKWEKTSTVNVALDWSFLRGRISGAFEYYYSKSTDLLTDYPISLVNGVDSWTVNEGTAVNQGLDFNISTRNIDLDNFKWRTSLTLSYTKNKVTHSEDGLSSTSQTYTNYVSGSIIRKGSSVDGFYSYQFAGLDEYGLPRFKNLTGNNPNMSNTEFLDHIFVYSGTRTPTVYGSFSTEFSFWKRLTLRAEFSYKLGYKSRLLRLYEDADNVLPLPEKNAPAHFARRWRNPGDEANTNIPVLTNIRLDIPTGGMTDEAYTYTLVDSKFSQIAGPTSLSGWYMYDYSDLRVVRADHIRFRAITLGYQLGGNWLKKLGVNGARLDFQMQNIGVIVFDKDIKGQDPDQIESVGMPVLPTYNLSLNLNF